jgi:hypothetical protein
LNSCFSASISLLVVIVVVVVVVVVVAAAAAAVLFFITVLCLFGDIPRLVSLLPDVRLLTPQPFLGSTFRVTLHCGPPSPVLKAL